MDMKNAASCDFSHIRSRRCNMTVYDDKIRQRLFNQHANCHSHHTDHNNFPNTGSSKIKMQYDKINVLK